MGSLTIGRRGNFVTLQNNDTKLGFGIEWEGAVALGRQLMYKPRGVYPPGKERVGIVSVRLEGDQVLIDHATDGRLLFSIPAVHAGEIGAAIVAKARLIEHEEAYEDIALDQAILHRQGVGFGLTNDPWVQHQAGLLAAWDSRIRRYIRSSKRMLQISFGVPKVSKQNGSNIRSGE